MGLWCHSVDSIKRSTINFTVSNLKDRAIVLKHLKSRTDPLTVTITSGIKRSTEQNRLQRLWIKELTEQSQEQGITSEEWRAYLKLHIGVPILREENEAFRLQYDNTIEQLTYEQKMSIMQTPIDFPVTRLMTVKQNKRFLDEVYRKMSMEGYRLTDPDWQGWNVE